MRVYEEFHSVVKRKLVYRGDCVPKYPSCTGKNIPLEAHFLALGDFSKPDSEFLIERTLFPTEQRECPFWLPGMSKVTGTNMAIKTALPEA